MKRQRDCDEEDGDDDVENNPPPRNVVRTVAPLKRARTTASAATAASSSSLPIISFAIKPSSSVPPQFVKPELFSKIADAIDLDEKVRNAAIDCLVLLNNVTNNTMVNINNSRIRTVCGCFIFLHTL